ncbi:MAG: prepilin-type N-terminal cleavage/methylation domain-containing protein [Myxococcales bacterium]
MTGPMLARRGNAGFTLVELLVALTGGLFISLAVFALSRDSGRFYQSETRLANATVGGMLGFERLRQDIARAGFLISPNATRDGRLCGSPNANWPVALQNLASVQVTTPLGTYPSLTLNGRTPPALLLAGSYASSDLFGGISYKNGNRIVFRLGNLYPDHPAQPPLLRLGNGTWPDTPTLASVFPVGGAVRIVQNGRQYYGVIDSTVGGTNPEVTITNVPPIAELGDPLGCGLNVIGSAASRATINVVNFVRYQLGTPRTVTGIANYQPMYAASNLGDAAPGEAGRTELMRVEQSLAGADIDGTEEVVAEYAVDFNLQITAATAFVGPDPTLAVIPPGSAQFATFTGATYGNPNNTPERIRSIRVRLGVRSREGDRAVTLANPTGGGLFRFNLGTGNADAYARVRTFQADVFLHNQADITW